VKVLVIDDQPLLRDVLTEPDDERRAVEAGLRFVRKPITFAQFEATMAEVVEQAGAAW
jgi:hypothetical protein